MSEIEELVSEFSDCTVWQDDAVENGNVALGNKFAERRNKSFQELTLHGNEGRDALAALFVHPRAGVRVMAAAYLLRHAHEKARAVLEAEAKRKGKGFVSFGAAQALERWKEGTWKLDLVE